MTRIPSVCNPHPSLRFNNSVENGNKGDRGVFANKSIKKGEILLKVKTADCFRPLSHLKKFDIPESELSAVEKYLLSLRPNPPSDWMASVLCLLHEKSLGDESRFSEYIASLPPTNEKIPHLLFATEIESIALQGTELEGEADNAREKLEKCWKESVEPITTSSKAKSLELWPNDAASFDLFLWGASMVTSRGFNLSSGLGPFLIPGVDLLNHAASPLDISTTLGWKLLDEEKKEGDDDADGGDDDDDEEKQIKKLFTHGVFVMRAEKSPAIDVGTEIRHSYGQLSDAETLRTYGFVDNGKRGHPFQTSFVLASEVIASVKETLGTSIDKQIKVAKVLGILDSDDAGEGKNSTAASGGKPSKKAKKGGEEESATAATPATKVRGQKFPLTKEDLLPESMVALAQVLCLDNEDSLEKLEKEAEEVKSAGGDLPDWVKDDVENNDRALNVLAMAVLMALDRCPTTLKEDIEILRGVKSPPIAVSSNPSLFLACVRLRAVEKKMLMELHANINELLAANEEDGEEDEEMSEEEEQPKKKNKNKNKADGETGQKKRKEQEVVVAAAASAAGEEKKKKKMRKEDEAAAPKKKKPQDGNNSNNNNKKQPAPSSATAAAAAKPKQPQPAAKPAVSTNLL